MRLTPFSFRVYSIVSSIPKGKVATYGQVARLAGNSAAARAVGAVMRANKDTKTVPCHRVVGSTGALTGYAYGAGVTTKRSLLEREGVLFSGSRVNLSASGWNI